MAKRLNLKLPSFKLTKRSTSGRVTHHLVPRGIDSEHKTGETCVEPQEDSFGLNVAEDTSADVLPSLYQIHQKQSIEAWRKISPDLLKIAIEIEAMPENEQCCVCFKEVATTRCLQCSSRVYFCSECFDSSHNQTNIFHRAEIWENGMFRPLEKVRTVDVRNHVCTSGDLIPLCCISGNGEEHNVMFATCACEPLVVTMVRARLWPSSPQRPHFGFSFELLDWAEALLLEAQVSLNDFCKAVHFKCHHSVTNRRNFYSTLIDSFEEYRWMKVELRHLSSICPSLDRGTVCPACPKESGSLVLSVDALFGLPRKKAAGVSHRESLHGTLFFGDQTAVDEHVSFYEMSGQSIMSKKQCNNFLAGDMLRSSRRYHALDETALFGCACRHEFPLLFINLKHGERLSYVVWLLEELVHRIPRSIDMNVMYDIACTLVQHLKASTNGNYLLDRINFSLPSFHAFGHNAACQALYSPLFTKGIGLSDGEVMERLWSYLRRFTRMTKEMRPAHRVDILTHALLYYGFTTKKKLPSLLNNRWKKATDMHAVTKQTLDSLRSSLSVTDDIVVEWIEEYKETMTSGGQLKDDTPGWKYSYFILLQSYYMAREDVTRSTDVSTSKKQKISSLNSQLEQFERKYDISSRWKPNDSEYEELRKQLLTEKMLCVRAALWTSVVKRHYLLRMKAKYADGQKIAKKLCGSIAKETKAAKKLFQEYNAAAYGLNSIEPQPIFNDILLPQSDFWMQHQTKTVYGNIPWKTREDIVQAFLLVKKCEEEMDMLKSDMLETIHYWLNCIKNVTNELTVLESQQGTYQRGLKSMLRRLQWCAECRHHQAVDVFSKLIDIPPTAVASSPSHSRNFSAHLSDVDSDTDTESDSDCSDSEFF